MNYKLLLLTLLCAMLPISATSSDWMDLEDLDPSGLTLIIPSSQVITKNSVGKIVLLYDEEGFIVKQGDEFTRVHKYNTDKIFKKFDFKSMAKYVLLNNKIKVTQFDNGEYIVREQGGLKGGGIFGAQAGFLAGNFAFNFVAYGSIILVSTLTGPAAPATAAALSATLSPFIQTGAMTAGLAVGMAGAVATGPI